ncbi:heme NO-binding domain-containing protein [Cognatishimia sp. SS12]|uniref:heme NO-binding domain-containing protein n=1 Tax=Cognatishimia sp. SS12 TaxID=2979465 RepID=UPI00232B40AD|nr:heme NO-binding domain-containing protein [Cognatishimia sp. SS12]MDC0736693.1 heme NO-binding domain-containing protein [Cognatishimia sp. SS12]
MHGLINRALQYFVTDTYGSDRWEEVVRIARLDFAEFEAMLHYEDALTEQVIAAIVKTLGVKRAMVLEDIGTYLVTHPNVEALRRLLRFGGESFPEFLQSLDDLADRSRLAVEDLELPELELDDLGDGAYSLSCRHVHGGFGYVLMGLLRTMADDYGALALLDHAFGQEGEEIIDIKLVDADFSPGRGFDLGAHVA